MKAGGSAGHRLVLSCQGAECHPWAHSRGKSRVGVKRPPAWPSTVTPILGECEEDEGMRGKQEEIALTHALHQTLPGLVQTLRAA